MRGLDTNVLVRYLTQDDAAQARRANALIGGAVAKAERLRLDVIVLCEVAWVLRGAYGLDKAAIVGTLERILDVSQFSIDDGDLLREALESFRAGHGDFADYILGLRNRRAGCTATTTFDRVLKSSDLFTVL